MTSPQKTITNSRLGASPLLNLLLVQGLAILLVGGLFGFFPRLSIGAAVIAQAAVAAVMSRFLFRQARWWQWIHAFFLPAALVLSRFGVHPIWFLLIFIVLLLFFGSAWRGRVPLFLSSREALAALDAILPRDDNLHFVDLGCGSGRVVAAVGRLRPTWRVSGVEAAWFPYLWSVARTRFLGARCRVHRRDLWSFSLVDVDVVYTYLSPTPMARVWKKLLLEMKRGCLISYRFAVPSLTPDTALTLENESVLYRWSIPRKTNGARAD